MTTDTTCHSNVDFEFVHTTRLKYIYSIFPTVYLSRFRYYICKNMTYVITVAYYKTIIMPLYNTFVESQMFVVIEQLTCHSCHIEIQQVN